MRFLVDAQLPPALARWLVAHDHEAEHVLDIGLASASDHAIWEYAGQTKSILVTKDEDFITLACLTPNGARIVWIRIGNTTRHALLAWLTPLLPRIEEALQAGETLIEVT
ncbi:MAG: DUF5615 family PIN-like protein [Magnetococcales bacterium]|nr:DUF5615 family PIN-like protein [Magnetococcales bacterium]